MAYYTEEQKEKIKKALETAKNNPDDDASKALVERLESGKMNFELKALGLKPVPVKRPKIDFKLTQAPQAGLSTQGPEESLAQKQVSGAASDVGSDFMEMGRNIKEGFQKRTDTLGSDIARREADGKVTLREAAGTGLGMANVTLRTAFDALGEAGMFAVKSVMTPEQEQFVADKFTSGLAATLEASEGSKGREDVERMIAAYNVWAEENPEDAANVRDTAGLMLSLAEAAGLKVGTTAARETADIAADAVTTAARKTEEVAKEVGTRADKTLKRTATAAGASIDEFADARRASNFAKAQSEAKDAVNNILQPQKVEDRGIGLEALKSLDLDDVEPTYAGIRQSTNDKIKASSEELDDYLDGFPETFTPDKAGRYQKTSGKNYHHNTSYRGS